jgi:hypothetical protein
MWKCELQKVILGPVCGSVDFRREFYALYLEVWVSEGNSRPFMWKCELQKVILGPVCASVNFRK